MLSFFRKNKEVKEGPKRIVDYDVFNDTSAALIDRMINAPDGHALSQLCEEHGGEYQYNEPGSGEMTYLFESNLFIKDCLVDWDEFDFKGPVINYL